jgi:hypothetical protein
VEYLAKMEGFADGLERSERRVVVVCCEEKSKWCVGEWRGRGMGRCKWTAEGEEDVGISRG